MRKSPRPHPTQKCSICGGPLRGRVVVGICRSNPECKRANESQHNYRASRQRKDFPPCANCGNDWLRKGRGEKLCGTCRETVFWCTPGRHVASLTVWVSAGVCRACRLIRRASERAEAQGITFALTWDYVESIWSANCPYLGAPLAHSTGHGPGRLSPTLDRIDPAGGYVPGNVEVISHMANTMKLDASPEQLVTFAREVLRRYAVSPAEVA